MLVNSTIGGSSEVRVQIGERVGMFRLIVFLLFLLACSACSPKLGKSIGMPTIPSVSHQKGVDVSGAEVFVNTVVDARGDRTIANYEGKTIEAKGDVALTVKDAVSRALEGQGFALSDFAPLSMTAEVRNWNADVKSGMPSSVTSEAKIYVEIRDPANKKIYSGTYSGHSMIQHASLGEEDIQKSLGTSMAEALRQIFVDAHLVEVLASF